MSPVGGYSTFVAFRWVDRNADHFAQKDEVLSDQQLYYNNVDPNNPTALTSTNVIDSDYHASTDNEADLRPRPRGSAATSRWAAAYTWRKVTDIPGWFPRRGITREQLHPRTPP